MKAHLETKNKNWQAMNAQKKASKIQSLWDSDTNQHKLPHIDDADESGGGDVGGENHLGVLEPADQEARPAPTGGAAGAGRRHSAPKNTCCAKEEKGDEINKNQQIEGQKTKRSSEAFNKNIPKYNFKTSVWLTDDILQSSAL